MQFVHYFNAAVVLVCILIWLASVILLRIKKQKSFIYILLFTLFYIYIVKVLDYTLFQFQSLLLLKYFMPGLMLQGQEAGKSLNLIPLITLTLRDVKTSLLNVLLMMPFGFGLPFITHLRMKKIVFIGALFSIAIELLQFTTGFIAKTTFRIADINDVIFNTIGVFVGYMLFVGFVRLCRHLFHDEEILTNSILQYILRCAQIDK